jgi:DNA mismatch repair ATPase MutS
MHDARLVETCQRIRSNMASGGQRIDIERFLGLPSRDRPGTRAMLLDDGTVRDLDLLPGDVRGASLFDALNTCATKVGVRVLRTLLRSPVSAVEDIVERQNAIRFLVRRHADVERTLGAVPMLSVQAYLTSNWDTIDTEGIGGIIEAAVVRHQHAGLFVDVREGMSSLHAMAGHWGALSRELAGCPYQPLASVREAFEAVLQVPAMQRLRAAHPSTLPARALLRLDHEIRTEHRTAIEEAIVWQGVLDAHTSLAAAVVRNGWIFPTISSDSTDPVRFRGLVHPLCAQAVGNDCELQDKQPVHVLTGPNMAGKTTFLRASAIAILLGQIGSGVPAQAAAFPAFDGLFSFIRIEDRLDRRESLFAREIHRVNQLADVLLDRKRLFCILDEPFRGTNVYDARDATEFLITRLSRWRRSRFLVSTHLADIAAATTASGHAAAAFFSGQLDDDDVLAFDYRLQHGVSDQRLGMRLMRESGLLGKLERANGDSAVG